MDAALVRTSRFLSKVLRHAPESVGLRLDEAGWVEVEALMRAARNAGVALDRPTLERVVAENDKKRFALSDDGGRVRASQGHSRRVAVDLGLAPADPPAHLFHGTPAANLPSIMRDGLRPGSRHHVHLSPDTATAEKVGRRRSADVVVLRVAAGEMAAAGHVFHRSANGVWLTAVVPPSHLEPVPLP